MYPRQIGYWETFLRPVQTRYEGLWLVQIGRAMWKHLVADDCGDVDVTGPTYRTKLEALAVLDRVAEDWGRKLR